MAMPPRPLEVPASAKWNGRCWVAGLRRSGFQDGRWRWWSRRGLLLGDTTFAKKKRHGLSRTWWDNGSPASEGVWKAGERADGLHREWARSGSKKSWRAFGQSIAAVVTRVEADFAKGQPTAFHYFDKAGNLRGRGGKALDPAVARAEKKKQPSAQDKLARLVTPAR